MKEKKMTDIETVAEDDETDWVGIGDRVSGPLKEAYKENYPDRRAEGGNAMGTRLIDGDRLIEWLEDLDARGRFVTLPDIRFVVSELAKQHDIEDAGMEPLPPWISVKDRLPEEDTDVLVWNCLGIEIAAYTTNPVKRWYSYNGQEAIAIYWMPLPEPPKEDKHD